MSLLWVVCTTASAQTQMSLPDAIQIALNNNFNIQINKHQLKIAQNLVHPGKAGMLPHIEVDGSYSKSGANTQQEFLNGTSVDKKNALSDQFAGAISLEWTLFDGWGMYARYDRLKQLQSMEEKKLQMTIQQLVFDVSKQYAEISKEQYLLEFDKQLLASTDTQYTIVLKSFQVGIGRKADVLLSQLELNRIRKQILLRQNQLNSLKLHFNEQLGQTLTTDFELDFDSYLYHLPDSLYEPEKILLSNLELKWLEAEQAMLLAQSKEIKSSRYPSLLLHSGYTYNKTENQAGFLLYNLNHGWNASLGIHWTLYAGNQLNIEWSNAKLALLQSKLRIESTKLEQERISKQAFDEYTFQKELVAMEATNSLIAKEHFTLIQNNYFLGSALYFELREAQILYESSLRNLAEYKYQMHLAAMEYLKVSGKLLHS